MKGPQRKDIRALDWTLLILSVSVLGTTILYPSLRLLWRAVTVWQGEAVLSGPGLEALLNTVVISFASVVTSGVVGTIVAFLLTRYAFPGRRPLAAMAYLPFTLPPLVGVLSFYYLIGRDGLVPRCLERLLGVEGVFLEGPWAILLIHTYSFYVFFYAMVSAALEAMDVSQLEAARTLGASRLRVFTRVMAPMLKPALLGAALLTFMSSAASFSAPYFFGKDYRVLTVRIYEEQRVNFHEEAALTMTVVLAGVSLLVVLLFRSSRDAGGVASKGVRIAVRNRAGRVLACAAAWVCILVLLIPHVTIAWLSFVNHADWVTEIVPTSLTLANYAVLFRDSDAFTPIRNSLWMSAVGAAGTLLLALPAAYLIGRRRPFGRWINVLVMIPWALPGTVIAMNLIAAFNTPWLRPFGVLLLPMAYFVRSVPLLTRMSAAALEPFDASLVEAGQTLGASRFFCLKRIVLPLLAPAVAAGTALVFATCLGEFVASILLYLPANIPIAVQINMEWRGSGVGSAFAYSVFLMLLVAGTFLVSRRFASRIL